MVFVITGDAFSPSVPVMYDARCVICDGQVRPEINGLQYVMTSDVFYFSKPRKLENTEILDRDAGLYRKRTGAKKTRTRSTRTGYEHAMKSSCESRVLGSLVSLSRSRIPSILRKKWIVRRPRPRASGIDGSSTHQAQVLVSM